MTIQTSQVSQERDRRLRRNLMVLHLDPKVHLTRALNFPDPITPMISCKDHLYLTIQIKIPCTRKPPLRGHTIQTNLPGNQLVQPLQIKTRTVPMGGPTIRMDHVEHQQAK